MFLETRCRRPSQRFAAANDQGAAPNDELTCLIECAGVARRDSADDCNIQNG
jgi:hypothetical protein